jgi:hypothetical protein
MKGDGGVDGSGQGRGATQVGKAREGDAGVRWKQNEAFFYLTIYLRVAWWVICINFKGGFKLDGRQREKPFCFYY